MTTQDQYLRLHDAFAELDLQLDYPAYQVEEFAFCDLARRHVEVVLGSSRLLSPANSDEVEQMADSFVHEDKYGGWLWKGQTESCRPAVIEYFEQLVRMTWTLDPLLLEDEQVLLARVMRMVPGEGSVAEALEEATERVKRAKEEGSKEYD